MSNPMVLLPFLEEIKGIDFLAYDPVHIPAPSVSLPPGVWTTIIEVTGEGFCEQLTQNMPASDQGVKITVDDVVVYKAYGSASGGSLGIMTPKYLQYDAGNVYVVCANAETRIMPTANAKSLPYSNGSDTTVGLGWGLLPMPLTFKNSIKLEAYRTGGGSSLNASFIGGMKK